jgi:hypothetical protein
MEKYFQMLEMSTTPLQSTVNDDDDDNDNDTTTINSQWFTKLKYNNCLLLLACLMSFIELSFLSCHFSIHHVRCSTFNSQYDSTIVTKLDQKNRKSTIYLLTS